RLPGSKRGFYSFLAIAEVESAREYADEVASKNLAECIRAKLQHAWDLAGVCRAKYKVLTIACWIAASGAGCGLLYLWLARAAVPGTPTTATTTTAAPASTLAAPPKVP